MNVVANNKKAVILLSGGLDSTTILAMARNDGFECFTVSFDYGQRHRAEVIASEKISDHYEVIEHRLIKIPLDAIGGSALTDLSIDVPNEETKGIPVTYVPARNTIFLSFALAVAEVVKANKILIGINAVDYSGYPDCRPEFIRSFQELTNLATKHAVEGSSISIDAPLIDLSKSEIISLGNSLGVDYSHTVSCYSATNDGLACGKCDSCRYRKKGFYEAGINDQTRYINS